jgi:Rod binding domain-containing protein
MSDTLGIGIPVDRIPASVRADGPKGEKLYKAALGFESFLVQAMTSGMTEGLGSSDDEDAATSAATEQLPEALAGAITKSGGLGLAEQLYASLKGRGAA